MSDPQDGSAAVNGEPKETQEPAVPPTPKLDIQKLHSLPSEQQDLYLFTFAIELERYALDLNVDDLSAQQTPLNEEVLKIINLKSPVSSKAIRNNIGRTLACILGKGNRRTLFDTINHLVAIISAGKGEKELYNKHAAVHCLGEVYLAAGDSALNLSTLACSSLLRLLKPARDHAGLRAAIFHSLGKIAKGIHKALDESIARDIWKQCRKAVAEDKIALLQARVCGCIETLVQTTSYFDTANHFEEVRNFVWKASETHIAPTRHAAASCLVAVLVKAYSGETPKKALPKPKKKKPAVQDLDDELENGRPDPARPMSPSGRKVIEKLELSLPDIFRYLSSKYTMATTSNRTRAMIMHCYCKFFQRLQPALVEGFTFKIIDHLLTDVLSNSYISHDRRKLLLTRKFVQKVIINCIGVQIFGESGRLDMARTLINNVLKNYPQVVKEIPQPSKHALVGALEALASLIGSVGSAFRLLADSCREALLQVLQHPSYTVQIHTAHCLRALVQTCPGQLLSCASICMNSVVRELGVLASGTGGKLAHRRCVGFANGLAAVISISPSQPLYGSLEISSRVLTIATDLLKSSSQAEINVADTQVQVSWILIGGLMALGPNFVKIHLSQFLLLWKNSLPKPLTRDNSKQRQLSELHYLTSVRESTLGSILLFLEFNGRLLTTDVSRRLAALLQNTLEYLQSLSVSKMTDDAAQTRISALSVQDLIVMVRRRVYQCFAKLIIASPHVSAETLSQSNLLTLAVALIADPDGYTAGSLSSTIANTSGTFESIWDVADNRAFGITGLVHEDSIHSTQGEQYSQATNGASSHEALIDAQLASPILGAREHDSISLYPLREQDSAGVPDPPATEVINAAISLFAVAFPLQASKIQEGVLEQLATNVASPFLQRDPGRRAAVTVNTAIALLSTLKVATGETKADRGDIRSSTVEKVMDELLKSLLLNQDLTVRQMAFESIGRLCNSAGNAFTSMEVDSLIETIVSNRDPNARSGCSMALGTIHDHVGGMAAGLHMKKIHGILMSLCSDPNPVVHTCAIKALSQVADSAGLAFSGNVSSTLGLLAQLWTCDSHNEQSSSSFSSTREFEMPTGIALARCLDSLISVLGPDIQEMSKAREMMLTLMRQFELDEIFEVQAECLKAWEHLSLFDSPHVDLPTYVQRLQRNLESTDASVRDVAVDGLYNLIRRDAEMIMSIGQQKLEDQLWATLNSEPHHEGLRNIILSWLSQSSLSEPGKWITRCQQVLTKISQDPVDVPVPEPQSAAPIQDEEVAGFNVDESKGQSLASVPDAAQELLRWQVRAFALQCLSDLVDKIGKDVEADPESSAGQVLQGRVADVIRLAFLASTASVVELQVGGLRLIDQILKIFGSTPDPDFSEALLLEQYQAQISSALTPAFAADSSPDLASAAVDVCATFLSAGLVTDVDRMGRILKLLVTAYESFTDDSQDSAVGDLRGLSTNAQTMVRLSVLSAWAELQVASTHQEYLVKVVKPFIGTLTPLWLSSLQEFARLRFEPDISNSTGPPRPDEGLDIVYASLNRQTLLKFYQDSWLRLVEAIASLIDQDSDFVFDALDGKSGELQKNGDEIHRHDINYRDEPAAFFFVLYGIVIEALTTRPGGAASRSESQTLEILSALKRILKPSVAGNAIFQDTVFSETMELFDRLALTEGLDVQLIMIEIARELCLIHPSAREDGDSEEHLSEDIEQLFELTRIIVLVLAGVLPNLSEQNPSARPQLPDEGILVIQRSLEALVDAAGVFPAVIKNDLYASILHIFSTILGTGSCQANVVPQALPVFKRFLQRMTSINTISRSTCDLIRSCLNRFLVILSYAQRRESESSLSCAKNTLLAITILLTTASKALPPNEPLIIRAIDDIRDCLQDLGLAKVAANCLRSILIISPKNTTDEHMAQYLLPHVIHFTVDTNLRDPENARTITAQALTSFVTTLSSSAAGEDTAASAMCIVLPILLTRAAAEGKDLFPETAKRILELAGGNLTPVFRGVVGKMSAQQRGFMERVIREGGGAGGQRGKRQEEREEPSIALKMNFG